MLSEVVQRSEVPCERELLALEWAASLRSGLVEEKQASALADLIECILKVDTDKAELPINVAISVLLSEEFQPASNIMHKRFEVLALHRWDLKFPERLQERLLATPDTHKVAIKALVSASIGAQSIVKANFPGGSRQKRKHSLNEGNSNSSLPTAKQAMRLAASSFTVFSEALLCGDRARSAEAARRLVQIASLEGSSSRAVRRKLRQEAIMALVLGRTKTTDQVTRAKIEEQLRVASSVMSPERRNNVVMVSSEMLTKNRAKLGLDDRSLEEIYQFLRVFEHSTVLKQRVPKFDQRTIERLVEEAKISAKCNQWWRFWTTSPPQCPAIQVLSQQLQRSPIVPMVVSEAENAMVEAWREPPEDRPRGRRRWKESDCQAKSREGTPLVEDTRWDEEPPWDEGLFKFIVLLVTASRGAKPTGWTALRFLKLLVGLPQSADMTMDLVQRSLVNVGFDHRLIRVLAQADLLGERAGRLLEHILKKFCSKACGDTEGVMWERQALHAKWVLRELLLLRVTTVDSLEGGVWEACRPAVQELSEDVESYEQEKESSTVRFHHDGTGQHIG